jgi:hypothetical protein
VQTEVLEKLIPLSFVDQHLKYIRIIEQRVRTGRWGGGSGREGAESYELNTQAHAQTELLGTFKRIGDTIGKDDLKAYALYIYILFD